MKNVVLSFLLLSVGLVAVAGVVDLRPAVPALPQHLATARMLVELVNEGRLMDVANTHSMEPTFGSEDLLIVEQAPAKMLKVGDIVIFKRRAHHSRGEYLESGLIGHRIVQKRGTTVITQGDNSPVADDDKIFAKSLRGRVAYAINGQSGKIRDMRVSREGKETDLQAIIRELSTLPSHASALTQTEVAVAIEQ